MLRIEKQKPLIQFFFFFLLFFILVFFIPKFFTGNPATILNDRLSTFATIFLGIFIEAAPFLFLGTLASGIIEVFLDRDAMVKIMPKQALLSALIGSSLGLIFPVCDCGVIPLTRRLFRKGFPIPAGIAFLLSAPILNPIVIISTATAFGIGRVLFLRIGVGVAIAIITGLIFSTVKTPWELLRPTPWITVEDVASHVAHDQDTFWEKMRQSFLISTDEFFEIGRYLIIGSMIAAAMQTFIPQSALLNIGKGPLLSVVIMVALAIILSICSTVDAFVALGFSSVFSLGSILAFLVFGPMVDIKSSLLLIRVFRKKTVMYLILIPLLLSILAGLIINFYIPS
ncbi:MAG TPA: permease [Anaerolineaceae bacterium]|nr:permease [Anaerolineaceae bacterium]